MESERKIEKLLRAFAKKCREEARDPLELHPANRRLLQGEVARRFRKPEQGGFFLRLIRGVRPGFVSALCAIAIMALLAAMLLPELSKAKSKSTYASKRAEERARSMEMLESPATSVPVAAPAPAMAPAETPAASEPESVTLNHLGGDRTMPSRRLSTSEVASLDKKKASPKPADSNSGYFDGLVQADSRLAVTNGVTASLDLPMSPVVTAHDFEASGKSYQRDLSVAENKPRSLAGELSREYKGVAPGAAVAVGDFAKIAGQRFVQVSDETITVGAKKAPVLAAFDLEQNGEQIRIVDSDGSVYEGRLQSATDSTASVAVTRGGDMVGSVARKESTDARVISETGQQYFRVAGTNRTLKQQVVFAGRFLESSNRGRLNESRSTNLITLDRQQALVATNGFSLLPLSSLGIRGTLVIGKGDGWQILAEPAVGTNR